MNNKDPYQSIFTYIKWGLQGFSYMYHDVIDLRKETCFYMFTNLGLFQAHLRDCDARHPRSLIWFWAKSQKMTLAVHSW